MKRLILSITLLMGMGISAQAQNWEFALNGTSTVVTNTVQNKGVFNTDQIHLDFTVENISAGALNAWISRCVISAPGGAWYEQVCFGNASGGSCTDLDVTTACWTDANPITINAGEQGLANVKITPDPSEAPATYRYYIGVQGDLYQDSIDLVVTSTVGIDEVKKTVVLSVSPNPANEYVNINVSNFEKGNLKVVDVLGNVIKSSSFDGSTKMNISEFRNGVYFIMISGEGVRTINRKLVVRH